MQTHFTYFACPIENSCMCVQTAIGLAYAHTHAHVYIHMHQPTHMDTWQCLQGPCTAAEINITDVSLRSM